MTGARVRRYWHVAVCAGGALLLMLACIPRDVVIVSNRAATESRLFVRDSGEVRLVVAPAGRSVGLAIPRNGEGAVALTGGPTCPELYAPRHHVVVAQFSVSKSACVQRSVRLPTLLGGGAIANIVAFAVSVWSRVG